MRPDPMHVAALGTADVPRYRALMLHAYAVAPNAFTSTPEERAAEPSSWWQRRVADPAGSSAAFGAFHGGELVGTVTIEFTAKPKTRHKALLVGMFVQESCRGLGAGAALVHAALAFARARPALRLVTLTVTEGNAPAIRLYERCGFRVFGTEPLAIATPEGYKAKVHMALPVGGATLPPQACLHFLCGKAGAGKSTLAKTLAAAHHAILISEDIWLARLFGDRMTTFDDYKFYAQRAKAVVGPLVIDLLAAGQNVVLDFPANTRASRAWFGSLCQATGAAHVLHYVDVPDPTCLQRIDKRNTERPEGSHPLTAEDFAHISSFFEAPGEAEGLRIEVHAAAGD